MTYHSYLDDPAGFAGLQDWAVTNLRSGIDSHYVSVQTARAPFNALNYGLSERGCENLTRTSDPTAHGYLSQTWSYLQNNLYGGQTLYAKGLHSAYWYRDHCGEAGAKTIFAADGSTWRLTTRAWPSLDPCGTPADPEPLPCCGTTLQSL